MSATSAQPTPSTAPAARTVLLPGSPTTYANRAYLRDLGLRWDPERHQWHGTTSADRVKVLREQLGLEVRCFGTLDQLPREPSGLKPGIPHVTPAPPGIREFSSPRFGDYSRTRFESRVLFGDQDEDTEEIATPTRQFSLRETTSGLPDDSREADERATARHLADLRGRVKAARAAVSRTPGLAEMLASDWRKAARFYARFGITETQFWNGVPVDMGESGEGFLDPVRTPFDWQEEVQARVTATLSDGTMICATEPIERPPGAWTICARPLK